MMITNEQKAESQVFLLAVLDIRKILKENAAEVLKLKGVYLPLGPESDQGEAMANIMLAYRHAEDAVMRLGKVIQALDGGVSIYKQ